MMHDLRYALRALLKSPGFTIVAVLTLALGIGATTAIFSVFDAVVLKSLPVRDPHELFITSVGHYRAYQAFRQETDLFSDVLASASIEELDATIDGGMAERTRVSLVSASYFSTLGVSATMGRVFGAGDERPAGEPAIAVVSHAYWQRRLARDAAVIGRVVRVRGVPITIVGVGPAGFFGEEVGASPDLWVPLTMWAQIVPGRDLLNSPGTSWLRIIGRLQPGVTIAQAEARLTITFRRVLEGIFGPRPAADVRRDIDASTVRLTPAGQGVSRLRGRFAQPLAAAAGRGHPRPAHQLCERRKSSARASRIAPARDRFASCARDEPAAAGSTVDDGESRAFIGRRCARCRACMVRQGSASASRVVRRFASAHRRRHGSQTHHIRRARLAGHGRPLRICSRMAIAARVARDFACCEARLGRPVASPSRARSSSSLKSLCHSCC